MEFKRRLEAAMEPLPHAYDVELEWKLDRSGALSSGPRPHILGGPPPQFDGQDRWWSPEHLLLASAGLCLMTTFFAVAEKSRLRVDGYRCRAEGTLDKTEEGIVFTAITLNVSLAAADQDWERAERLLETAKKHCIVSKSLKTPVKVLLERAPIAGLR